jgi:anaerobic ribonucleoside-triphosphate reductase activating protein
VTPATLRLARLHFPVTALGPGRRLGIWVQGCALACPGCMSRDTWDPRAGQAVGVADLATQWQQAAGGGADGITVSGGEPLDQAPALAELLLRVRRSPDGDRADILVYTGYELAEAYDRAPAVLAAADAIITGRYEAARPTALIWRGSAGQQLIPLTERGRERYRPYIAMPVARPPMQVGADELGPWLIGVPRRGDLRRLEAALRSRGITASDVSWRPRRAGALAGGEAR